jgi:hypothetical protein
MQGSKITNLKQQRQEKHEYILEKNIALKRMVCEVIFCK